MWLHHLANILRHAIFLLQNKALRLLHRAKTYIMSRILPLRELRRTVARGRPFKKGWGWTCNRRHQMSQDFFAMFCHAWSAKATPITPYATNTLKYSPTWALPIMFLPARGDMMNRR